MNGAEPIPTRALPPAYAPTAAGAPVDLRLDGNEGVAPSERITASLAAIDGETLRRYPDARALEASLARRHGVEPASVFVTAGADEAIDRLFRAFLTPDREIVVPVPTFSMIPRYAALTGARLVEVPWGESEFPIDAVVSRLGDATAVVTVVSPNNPTGTVATARDVERVARAAPQAVVLLDHAYVEFADGDLGALARNYANIVVTRTFSKAYGMAGVRVGYAVGRPRILDAMRASGGPYSVAGPSLALAAASLSEPRDAMRVFVDRVRVERERLAEALRELGADVLPSHANFVFARFDRSDWVHDALRGLGIAVRRFSNGPARGGLRITCPGNRDDFARLLEALEAVLAPQAILFDLDGVLADVSRSYRETILATVRGYGVSIEPNDIAIAKRAGNANNDWVVTHRLLRERGVACSLEDVTERFEAIYQGANGVPGLRTRERLVAGCDWLADRAGRFVSAIVTGRPRGDADRFLEDRGIADRFDTVVTMEDARAKPDPEPVRLALDRLGVRRAWMIGDTPDDIVAARAAGVVPIGIAAPGEAIEAARPALVAAGASRVLERLEDLDEIVPNSWRISR